MKTSYMVESDDKVWLFYNTRVSTRPLRPDASIKQMRAWHGRDGLALGNRGLAWVATHFTELGDPYRAGYFIDYHRDITDEKRFQVRIGDDPPGHPRHAVARIPPGEVAFERRIKALRNYARGYASPTILTVARTQPEELTEQIVELAVRTVLFALNDRVWWPPSA